MPKFNIWKAYVMLQQEIKKAEEYATDWHCAYNEQMSLASTSQTALAHLESDLEMSHKVNEKLMNRLREYEEKTPEYVASMALKNEIESTSVTITAMVNDSGKMYGSLGPDRISRVLKEQGILNIDKDQIQIEIPIKELGIYNVPIQLHEFITAQLKTWVVKS